MLKYFPPSRFEQPLREQLKNVSYPALEDMKVRNAEEYEEEFGSGVAHALLATGSSDEMEGVVHALRRFKPLSLHHVETGRSSLQEKPQRAILFGRSEPAVPVVVALQAKYLCEQNEMGPPNTADLLLSALFPSPLRGIRPAKSIIIEFDLHPSHKNRRETVKKQDLDRGEASRGVRPVHVERKEGYSDEWDKSWKEQTDEHVKGFIRNASQRVKERIHGEFEGKSSFRRRPLDQLPIICRFDNLNLEKFRNAARSYCFEGYRSASQENIRTNVVLRVKQNSISVEDLHPRPKDVREAIFQGREGVVNSTAKLESAEKGNKGNP